MWISVCWNFIRTTYFMKMDQLIKLLLWERVSLVLFVCCSCDRRTLELDTDRGRRFKTICDETLQIGPQQFHKVRLGLVRLGKNNSVKWFGQVKFGQVIMKLSINWKMTILIKWISVKWSPVPKQTVVKSSQAESKLKPFATFDWKGHFWKCTLNVANF